MHIAFVNNQFQLGGAETVVQQLHRRCLAADHDSTLWVAEGKTYPCEPGLRPLYPRSLSYLSHTRLAPVVQRCFPRWRWTDAAFRALGRSDADLVHIHNFHGIYARLESLAELARKKPVVWTFHRFWGITGGCDHPIECDRYLTTCGCCPRVGEFPIPHHDNTAEQLALKLRVLRDAPMHIVAPSLHLADRVRHSPVGSRWPVHYIPNGVQVKAHGFARKHDVEFRAKFGLKPGRTSVLVVNHNFRNPIKGFQLILPALRLVDPETFQLMLAGGHSRWALEQLPPGVQAVDCGYVSDRERLAELYEAADIFLYASPGENFPCASLEAMAAECCVVTTPTDGLLEQIQPGQNGLIAESMAGPDLAAAFQEALDSPSLCQKLGKQARLDVAERFSEDLMVARHLRLYAHILGRPL